MNQRLIFAAWFLGVFLLGGAALPQIGGTVWFWLIFFCCGIVFATVVTHPVWAMMKAMEWQQRAKRWISVIQSLPQRKREIDEWQYQGQATPVLPEPKTELKPETAPDGAQGDVNVMRTSVINEQAGPKAHPFLFWLNYAVLSYIYVMLFQIFFKGLKFPAEGIRLNSAVTLEPHELVPFFALFAFGAQCMLKRWRPEGWWYGFWDLLISLAPVAIIVLWITAQQGVLNYVLFVLPLAVLTKYAFMAAISFGIGALLDLPLNMFKTEQAVTRSGVGETRMAGDTDASVPTSAAMAAMFAGSVEGFVIYPILPGKTVTPQYTARGAGKPTLVASEPAATG